MRMETALSMKENVRLEHYKDKNREQKESGKSREEEEEVEIIGKETVRRKIKDDDIRESPGQSKKGNKPVVKDSKRSNRKGNLDRGSKKMKYGEEKEWKRK
jgi:hypothetical protein